MWYRIQLTAEQRKKLEETAASQDVHPRVAKRARVLLMSAERDDDRRTGLKYTIEQVASAVGYTMSRVTHIRALFMRHGLDRALNIGSHATGQFKITQAVENELARLIAMDPPSGCERWTLQLLQQRLVEGGFVDKISLPILCKFLRSRGMKIPNQKHGACKIVGPLAEELRRLIATPPPAGKKRWTAPLLRDSLVRGGFVASLSLQGIYGYLGRMMLAEMRYDSKNAA